MTKTIYEQVEEGEALLAQDPNPSLNDEEIADDTEIETTEETPDEPEEKAEEKPVAPPLAQPQEPPIDNATFARMRYELAEYKRREAEREAAAKAPKVETDPEPNKAEDRESWLEWKTRQIEAKTQQFEQWQQQQEQTRQEQAFEQAQINGFLVAERQFKAVTPDYEDVSNHMIGKLTESVRTLNPMADDVAVNQFVKKQIITWAEQAAQQGFHPAEYLYKMSKNQFGYQPKAEPKPEAKQDRPNLSVVNKNKQRSANGLSGSSGKSSLSIKALAEMPVNQISDMMYDNPGELESLMKG